MNPTPTAFVLSLAVAAALSAQDRPKDPLAAAWWDAKAAAKQHKAPILAFVLPPKGQLAVGDRAARTRKAEVAAGILRVGRAPAMRTARDVMLRQVQLLRRYDGTLMEQPRPTDAQMVFALSVPVFASAAACGAKERENVVLLDARGQRLRGFRLDLLDRDAFVKALGAPLFDRQAILARQATVTPAGRQALASLQRELRENEGRVSAYAAEQKLATLAPRLHDLGPALVEEREGKLAPVRELWGIEGARAPLGTKAEQQLGDPCPGCGMGYTPPALQTILKLVGP
jgi:hypothetical protein